MKKPAVMIPQNRFCTSAEQIFAALLGMVALASAHVASAAPPDTTQALELITQTADRTCNVVSTKGEAESADVTGQVQAQLRGLAAKLATVGVSGTGSINNEQYQNVLRQDLASTLHDSAECKLKVLQTIQAKLLPPPTENCKQRQSALETLIADNTAHLSRVSGEIQQLQKQAHDTDMQFTQEGIIRVPYPQDVEKCVARHASSQVYPKDNSPPTRCSSSLDEQIRYIQEKKQEYSELQKAQAQRSAELDQLQQECSGLKK